jgi:hypothetical protein
MLIVVAVSESERAPFPTKTRRNQAQLIAGASRAIFHVAPLRLVARGVPIL